MVEQRLMSFEEETRISLRAHALEKAGRKEEADALFRSIPMMPFAAQFIKKYLGVDALLAMDRNMAEVEQAYGKDWLAK